MALARWYSVFHRVFLDGTSTFDAWLNTTSFQTSQVLLTFPYSFAQLGMASGITFQLFYAALGCWACYTTASLYLVFREKQAKQNIPVEEYLHTIQWHEVLGGLLGYRWRIAGLVLNTGYQLLLCVIAIAGASSLAYLLNNNINKRNWTIILGGCFLSTVLIPRAQYYRVWSFMGLIATTYTAWYLVLATIVHGRQWDVKHTGPTNSRDYFTGATNLLYAFGGHAVTTEIIDAMRKPKDFSVIYNYCILYILTLIILPSAITVYWAFGDTMLQNSYALSVLPDSKFRQTAAVLMLLHQFMQFGFLSLPIFMTWEKFLGIHQSNYFVICAARVPIVLVMWFLSIMLPFIGIMDSVVGAFFATFCVYIVPCAAHMVLYRSATSRSVAQGQLPYWMPSWTGVYCLNLLVVLWVFIMGIGFGGWSAVSNLLRNVHTFGLFPKCYQCPK